MFHGGGLTTVFHGGGLTTVFHEGREPRRPVVNSSKRRLFLYGPSSVVAVLGGVLVANMVMGSFTIAGSPTVPVPRGAALALDLAFTNRNYFAVSITDVRVTVRSIRAPHADTGHPCTADDFAIEQVPQDVKVLVAGRARSSLSSLHLPHAYWPRVGLRTRSVNQDGCAGASLTLAYTASGTVRIL